MYLGGLDRMHRGGSPCALSHASIKKQFGILLPGMDNLGTVKHMPLVCTDYLTPFQRMVSITLSLIFAYSVPPVVNIIIQHLDTVRLIEGSRIILPRFLQIHNFLNCRTIDIPQIV